MPMDNNGIVLVDDNLLDYKLKTKRLNKKTVSLFYQSYSRWHI